MNIESLGLLSSIKLLKFQTYKNEKSITSYLEKVKKGKVHFFDLHKNFANENILKEIFFLSCEKMLGHGQVAIKNKMRSGTIWQRAPIVKLERSIFLVWTLEKSIYLVLHP